MLNRSLPILTLLLGLALCNSSFAAKPDRDMPSQSNKQSLEGSTRGQERAAQRRSEQGAAHAKEGQRGEYSDSEGETETLGDIINERLENLGNEHGLNNDLERDGRKEKGGKKERKLKQKKQPDEEKQRGFFQRIWPFGEAE